MPEKLRPGWKLNIEMPYADYDPQSQATPSRMEFVIMRSPQDLERARELAEAAASRSGIDFSIYEGTNLVLLNDDEEYANPEDAARLVDQVAEENPC